MAFKGKNHRDLSAVSTIDWARLAAYIDGEGCISIKSVKGYRAASRRVFYVDVAVCNTDFRLIKWMQDVFGGSVYIDGSRRQNDKWAAKAVWNVSSRYASDILSGCLPYFIIKREQADTALSFQATVLPDRRFGRSGRPDGYVAMQDGLKQRLSELKSKSARSRHNGGILSSTVQ